MKQEVHKRLIEGALMYILVHFQLHVVAKGCFATNRMAYGSLLAKALSMQARVSSVILRAA
ncbi:hypothetical protein A3742_01165 [Oleiphilus sp. HI0071]|nr:hypothetical protein A3737_20590 [Oleiphilus sp. HI0065]KZY81987.1 hypothetical protein A3742_01165 [Oleiphilus sp. HI0071]KZY91117.1 hypothetical protein A3744_04420 [Oleiphilus sp. HI0073]KZZ18028.1 hypothetical protein A3751_09610 [Oleiphilus sp. HI0080]KZZ57683.1 hypothetical protein A3760_29855 [Oleiphilus sp. HI0122]KZZ81944.1 hypothetical protein A3767_05425 [Oleiphilus sp. HI0133]